MGATHTHTKFFETAVLMLKCFTFQINDCWYCFLGEHNPDLKQPYVCLISHLHGGQLVLCNLSFSFLSRDLPVRGRYDIDSLPLDSLVSHGGKLSFFIQGML